MAHKAEQKQNQKDKKQNLRDSRSCNRNSGKPQHRGNQCHYEKSQRPAQHLRLLTIHLARLRTTARKTPRPFVLRHAASANTLFTLVIG